MTVLTNELASSMSFRISGYTCTVLYCTYVSRRSSPRISDTHRHVMRPVSLEYQMAMWAYFLLLTPSHYPRINF